MDALVEPPRPAAPLESDRVARQSALMTAAVALHKREIGLEPAHHALTSEQGRLLEGAREALLAAQNGNRSVWDVLHNLNGFASTRAFLYCGE